MSNLEQSKKEKSKNEELGDKIERLERALLPYEEIAIQQITVKAK